MLQHLTHYGYAIHLSFVPLCSLLYAPKGGFDILCGALKDC